jgi:hypothetical protein
MGGMRVIESL